MLWYGRGRVSFPKLAGYRGSPLAEGAVFGDHLAYLNRNRKPSSQNAVQRWCNTARPEPSFAAPNFVRTGPVVVRRGEEPGGRRGAGLTGEAFRMTAHAPRKPRVQVVQDQCIVRDSWHLVRVSVAPPGHKRILSPSSAVLVHWSLQLSQERQAAICRTRGSVVRYNIAILEEHAPMTTRSPSSRSKLQMPQRGVT
jgi:hypothetical protein